MLNRLTFIPIVRMPVLRSRNVFTAQKIIFLTTRVFNSTYHKISFLSPCTLVKTEMRCPPIVMSS